MCSPQIRLELFDLRLTFVLSARDGALPFSGVLYHMNNFTKTPVNTVWFCAAGSISLGALVFGGTQAINAVFSISITAQYVAFTIPLVVRWIWRKENGWTPGPFSLGAWVSTLVISNFGCDSEVKRKKLSNSDRVDFACSSRSLGWRSPRSYSYSRHPSIQALRI